MVAPSAPVFGEAWRACSSPVFRGPALLPGPVWGKAEEAVGAGAELYRAWRTLVLRLTVSVQPSYARKLYFFFLSVNNLLEFEPAGNSIQV